MTDLPILRDLGYIVVAATAFAFLSRKAKVPSIVAFMLAGLALGPVTGLVIVSDAVDTIAEVGIALLLFLVGLELSFDRIRDVGRVAVIAGLGQVAFTAVGGFLLSMVLGFGALEAVFIGTALTFSSTVVVVKLLDQKGELQSLYGRIAVGIFLVQDLVVIVVLTFLAGLSGPESAGFGAIAMGTLRAFGGMGLLLAAALLSARFVLPRVFGWIAGSLEALFIWSLFWCFLLVQAAELLDLSLEIGAFLAGISLAQLPFTHELRRRIHPLMNFFIAIFFVSLGIRMELGAAQQHVVAATILSLFVLIGNPFIFIWIIARMGYGRRTAFLTSVTVAQISEFSFIFAAMGMATGIIDEATLSIIGVVGVVTIGVSAYMILYNHELYALFERRGWLRLFGDGSADAGAGAAAALLEGHIIIVGVNTLARRLVEGLRARGETVLVIDTDASKLRDLDAVKLVGNAEDPGVLEEASLDRARLLISTLQIEDANILLAYRAREAGVPCSIHAFDPSMVEDLQLIGANHLMVSKHDGIRQVAAAMRAAGVID